MECERCDKEAETENHTAWGGSLCAECTNECCRWCGGEEEVSSGICKECKQEDPLEKNEKQKPKINKTFDAFEFCKDRAMESEWPATWEV